MVKDFQGQVFATRVWGFEPELWPVASFGSDGICTNLIRQSSIGDLLVFVGTKGLPTQEAEQGKILGYCEYGRDIVDTLSVLDAESLQPESYDERGQFRWPRAMVMTRAWQIDSIPLPDLVATIGRQLPRMATTYAVPLEAGEVEHILSLRTRQVDLHGTDRFNALRLKAERLAGRSHGPVPGTGARRAVAPAEFRSACTYAFRFGKSDCFKIGWAYDPVERLKEVNKHVPVEVIGAAWQPFLNQNWDTGTEAAYAMEQRVLDLLPQEEITGERVQIAPDKLQILWARAFAG